MNQRTSMDMHLRLAEARERAGFATASDAARRFGWNENTYRSHENGERGLKVEVAYKYARAFRVRFEWLMIGQQSDSMPTTESHALHGYIDDNGKAHRYSEEDVGKYKRLVAISSYLSRMPSFLYELRTTRPLLGCWPGDLLIAIGITKVVRTTFLNEGDIGIVELENGSHIVRKMRFNADRTLVDAQLYSELGPEFVPFKNIFTVECIIKKRAWSIETMEEWQALLLDPYRKRQREEPRRTP